MHLQRQPSHESLASSPSLNESESPEHVCAQQGEPTDVGSSPASSPAPETERANSNASSPIDQQELLARCMGRVDLLEKLLSNFDQFLSPQVAELEQAVQMGEMKKIREIAHRLRGAALTISAHELSRCAERLEGAAFDGAAAESANCLEDLLRECERISSAVRTSIARN